MRNSLGEKDRRASERNRVQKSFGDPHLVNRSPKAREQKKPVPRKEGVLGGIGKTQQGRKADQNDHTLRGGSGLIPAEDEDASLAQNHRGPSIIATTKAEKVQARSVVKEELG